MSVLQLCFRPKQVSSFFIAAFFPHLGPSLSDWPPIHLCCRSNRCSIRHLLPLSFRFFPPSFKSFCLLQAMHSKPEDFFLRWFHTFVDCSFAPSNYRFCHCLYPLRHKLSPINEGCFLKILFSVSSHSRFVLSTPHRLASFRVDCSLMRTDSIIAAPLRVSDSSIQSLSLSPLFTDGFCFLFPSPLGSPNTLSLTAFPLLLLYRFHLVYIMHCLLYAPFAFRIHFDLVYPKHE